jgi:hypothetical protein
LAVVGLLSIAGAFALSCAKDPLRVDRNRPPRTYLVAAPVDTTVDDLKYSYRIHLYWRGEDLDGYVVGFLWSWDDSSLGAFRYTTKTDSIFELTVNDSSQLSGGVGTNPGNARPHTFFIRAVDNLGKQDPALTIFNRRSFSAGTESPSITFTGSLVPRTDGMIDTLCDHTPFVIRWFGRDPDGVVTRYRFNVGSIQSMLSPDSFAYFNDPSQPTSTTLVSGLYTMTVTAVDNANSVGRSSIQFVVNRDPETGFLPLGAPIGHFIQPFFHGQLVNIVGTFAPGDTVPYRSTVWWEWDGGDWDGSGSPGGCVPDTTKLPDPRGCTSGWSFLLRPGARNNNEPYNIGFLDTLTTAPTLLRFNNNNPDLLGPAGFVTLILDSLDAGTDLIAQVATRDCSGRADGTPASFRFNCNFPPALTSVSIGNIDADPDTTDSDPTMEPCKNVSWVSEDYEDGLATIAEVRVDDTLRLTVGDQRQYINIPDRIFRALSPGPLHSVKVRVIDRAGIFAPLPAGEIEVTFNMPSPRP